MSDQKIAIVTDSNSGISQSKAEKYGVFVLPMRFNIDGEEYIEGNLRLVLSVIKRFASSNENVDDLFQIGCIGLIKAIDNFDCTLNVKFSTYAVPMIIGEIRRFLRDNNSIRVSRSLRDTAYKAIHAREILSRKSFKEPTLDEIAKEAVKYVPNVVMTTVETTITHEEEKECQAICDRLGGRRCGRSVHRLLRGLQRVAVPHHCLDP